MAHDLAPLAGLRRRTLFVGVLLVGLWSVWVSRTSGQTVPTIHLLAEIGEGFFNAIVFTQLSLVLLAAPAATAGTICQDRSSGRLAQLLATDLSDAEIVLGKLGARLVPVVGLVACALPALAICVLMGGVDPLALAGAFLITVCLGIFGCALALAFSVWAAKPYEAILATYAFFMVWLLAIPTWDNLGRLWGFPTSPDWLIWSHPFYLAFAPYVQPGKVGVLDYLEVRGGHAHQLVGAFGAGHRQDAGRGRRRRRPLRLPAGRARRPGHVDSQPENWRPERSDARSEPRALV